MRSLRISMYEEHLEEASFLYSHRERMLQGSSYDSTTIAELDARHEAHLDGLVLGDDLALALCQERARTEDAGALHGAVSVFCRHGRADLIDALVVEEDDAGEERLRAIEDAMAREAPPDFAPLISTWLVGLPGAKASLFAHAAAVQRMDVQGALVRAALKAKGEHSLPLLRAVGRLRADGATMLLYKHMQLDEHAPARDGAVAALMLGDPGIASLLAHQAGTAPWAAVALGLAGRDLGMETLSSCLKAEGEVARDALLALGMLGRLSSCGAILDALASKALAPWAAVALYLITGTPLQDLESEDTANEDEDDAAEAWAAGGLSTSRERWSAHLAALPAVLRDAKSVRGGHPYHPRRTIGLLRSGWLPKQARRYLVDELAIRHRQDIRDLCEIAAPEALRSLADAEARLGWSERGVASCR
jgi:hypothetical protein